MPPDTPAAFTSSVWTVKVSPGACLHAGATLLADKPEAKSPDVLTVA
jgi:hypothetical protein